MLNRTTGRRMTRGARLGGLLAIAAGCAFGLLAARAGAEPDPPPRSNADFLAAHAVARDAMIDLFICTPANQRDFRINEELLGIAANLARTGLRRDQAGREVQGPTDDQTLLRLWMEAAIGAGDGQTVREISRRLLKIDPDDTVTQLRLISAQISDLQTAEQRLAAMDKFIGPEGDAFDPSVRSRLALDAALLSREQGDMDGFAERLSKALEFDSTNKDAAALGLAYYAQTHGDPDAILDWQFAILLADPLDPDAYSTIVDHLLGHGAYKGALRMARLHRRLCNAQGRFPSAEQETRYDLAEWNTSGAETVIRRLSDTLEKMRQQAFETRKALAEQGKPLEHTPTPEQTHLPMSSDRSRYLCAVSVNDRDRSAAFMRELTAGFQDTCRDAMDPLKRPRGMTDEDARSAIEGAKIELAWLRVLGGQGVADAVTDLGTISPGAISPEMAARIDAWMTLRKGDQAEAERKFTAIAPTDPYGELGLAQLAETRGDAALAMRLYGSVARRAPGDIAGAMARTRYAAPSLAGEPLGGDETSRTLEANVAGAPDWLETIVDNPRRMMALEATLVPGHAEVSPVERTPIRVTLRNTSPVVLAMGPDKPLNTRLMFAPMVDIGSFRMDTSDVGDIPGGENRPRINLGYVASMDRRLRLKPGEALDIIAWPDMGMLSFEMERQLPRSARVRWRVLQGFELVDRPGGGKQYDASPMCLSADVPTLNRRMPNRAGSVFDSLQLAAQQSGPRELADLLVSMKTQLYQQKNVGSSITPENVDQLMETLALRFPQMERPSRILTLALVPPATTIGPASRLDQVAVSDPDEDVVAVLLALRVFKPDDPIFANPRVVASPRLTALAQLVLERLQAGQGVYATVPIGGAPGLLGKDEAAGATAPATPTPTGDQAATPDAPAPETPRSVPRPIIVPPNPTPVPTIQ